MGDAARRTSNPKKNLTVSIAAMLFLMALIGAMLLFGPSNEETPVNPTDTTQNVSQETT